MNQEKQKKGNNQTVILLAGGVILLLIVFAFLWMLDTREQAPNINIDNSQNLRFGQVSQEGILLQASQSTWALNIITPGRASTVGLIVGEETFCKKNSKPIPCSVLKNGNNIKVSGVFDGKIFDAKEIELLDEIVIELDGQ